MRYIQKLGVMILECIGGCLGSVHAVYSNGQAQCKVCGSIQWLPEKL